MFGYLWFHTAHCCDLVFDDALGIARPPNPLMAYDIKKAFPNPHNVGGRVYNRGIERKTMFDNVINDQAIQELTPEQVDQLLSILEKAGY
jgi:hypothetical protein